MKINFLFVVLFAVTLNSPAQNKIKQNELMQKFALNFDTLGLSYLDLIAPAPCTNCGTWNTPTLVKSFTGKSATGEELMKFIHDPHQFKLCRNLLGDTFYLIAIDEKGVTDVLVKNGKIKNQEQYSKNDDSQYWTKGQRYLKKQSIQ